ncbi:ComEA family DNA-binding protein [Corynebacterium pacaense]|uniref:ComEA family DNA-binding protein n=1 Tax=Corynebacterium pacaense TaxID=1816684 RepID=UPI0009BAD89D|nr:ComEA family DNA-binding protein [Corynebacterium pacaense]
MKDISSRIAELTRPTGTEDLLNVSYPEPRLRIGVKHAVITAAAVAALALGWFLLRQDTEPVAASALVAVAPETEIVVSVVGHVEKQGVVTLPADARIADALTAAGALPDADLASVNLAQKLGDGQQIAVSRVGEADGQGAGPAATDPGLLSLNGADSTQLQSLPGVGEKTAAAIIAHRDSIGGFTSVEQLMEVKGIGPAKFAEISPQVAP